VARSQVDENLSELERCSLFLKGNEEVQIQHAFRSLPDVTARNGRVVFTKLPGSLKAALASSSAQSSVLLAQSFTEIFNRHLIQVILSQLAVRRRMSSAMRRPRHAHHEHHHTNAAAVKVPAKLCCYRPDLHLATLQDHSKQRGRCRDGMHSLTLCP
jgi:hypothetical protein